MEAGTEHASLPCSLCYLGPLSACAGNSRLQVVVAELKAPEIDPLCRILHTWLGKTGFEALIFKYNPKFYLCMAPKETSVRWRMCACSLPHPSIIHCLGFPHTGLRPLILLFVLL